VSTRADAAQVRRWQEEVARDPGSPAFLPLAEVYLREGRLEVARRLCVRGLERSPEHVDAHALLGRVYREIGELDNAFDEWDIALRLDPSHQGARRALGYLCLERRDWPRAIRHLEAALAQEPGDERLARALALAKRHAGAEGPVARAADPSTLFSEPLDRFVRETRVRLVLLLEPSGRVLAHHGFSRDLDLASFATLAAGIYVASRALAQMLGQPRFQQQYQGQGERQLFLGSLDTPGGDLILLAVFGGASNIGLVRVFFDALAREAAELPWWTPPGGGRVDAVRYEAELASGLHGAPAGTLPHPLRP
jgi:tetratricopeptide (TPR) repeat protein